LERRRHASSSFQYTYYNHGKPGKIKEYTEEGVNDNVGPGIERIHNQGGFS